MKEQIQSPITIVICILIAAYLGGFFWVRSGCIQVPGTKIFIVNTVSPKGKMGCKYYKPIFWIEEKLLSEQIIFDAVCHYY